ncbi:mitochondrial distribution and morphology protein 10 [Colletotrichum spaethianum]|uniref:Mitochondrial distribution and morphology protein 10 n=1 Tax=Colletotrichum spaethianum TaxID=700344 RepID=A0AA37PG82_9PEZI|nr:mitochondrial distribution and morphology protein 10 [Colletotrichum spaethianum]GKT51652.1 mitochondrial distribution and morphology protein 10 [Colletotrichum spaethianum]
MREFMSYVQSAFYEATGWNRDNSYSSLNATADALLNFPTPQGLRLTLSSLATPHFATSYQLGSVGVVDGSISYLYSSVPLRANLTPQSDAIPPAAASLLYGRLYLPESMLEALVVKRVSPALQLQLSAVSGKFLRNGGTLLGLAQYDVGRYAVEGLASSDGGLLGFRGLYNFGGDAENNQPSQLRSTGRLNGKPIGFGDDAKERIYGRFSAGGEIYYGTLNKSGGVSLGGRFATLPEHRGTPLTATLTLNPLMGNISASYAVVAGKHCSLATRMDFNVYSYESDWSVGMELWRKNLTRNIEPALSAESFVKKERSFQAKLEWRLDEPDTQSELEKPRPVVVEEERKEKPKDRSFQAKMEWRLDDPALDETEPADPSTAQAKGVDEYGSVIKARLDQNMKIGVLWEGRVKSLLFSLGSAIDLRKLDSPFRTLGVEIQFSS